jgi:hypothetical protein
MVSIARAILAGEVEVLEGCQQLAELRHALPDGESKAPDILTFAGVDSELDDVPTGHARDLWAPEALAAKDGQRDEYLARARSAIEEACRSLVAKYSSS